MECSPTSWWRPLRRDTFRQIWWHMDHSPAWKMHQSLSTYSAAMRYHAVTADYSSDHPASSLQSPWGVPSTHTQSAVSLGCNLHPYTQPAVCSFHGVHPPSIHSLQSPWGAPSIHTQSAVSLGCTLHPHTGGSLPGLHPPSLHPARSLQFPWGAPSTCTQSAVSLGCTLHPYTVCSLPGVHPPSTQSAVSLGCTIHPLCVIGVCMFAMDWITLVVCFVPPYPRLQDFSGFVCFFIRLGVGSFSGCHSGWLNYSGEACVDTCTVYARTLCLLSASCNWSCCHFLQECFPLGSTSCADLCWYLFHPCVDTAESKRSWSFCQKCRWQVSVKHSCILRLWLWMKWHWKLVHGCMVHTHCMLRQQQFHVAPAM